MEQNNFLSWIFILFGCLILGAAIFNWNYFFKLRKAQMLVKAVGLTTARIIYAVLGLIFALTGANHLFNLGIFPF
ncbi:Imm17 family immunity protein [Plebeiibacterium marinum]|uniref:Imm17 family immunity protein n=1 Tax=Plebeiibacterium marinum TaxID=2992111 RepID=A0AAE3MHY9_9BACT|nr:Imm17 family immunity protein [Plebeiobacterium marinum]MCW3807966.1 Imm17 family immunity protein [Plebeiobacterium marinum]